MILKKATEGFLRFLNFLAKLQRLSLTGCKMSLFSKNELSIPNEDAKKNNPH